MKEVTPLGCFADLILAWNPGWQKTWKVFNLFLEDALFKVQGSPTCKLPELSLDLPRLVRWQKTKEGFPWMASMGLPLFEHLFQASLAV